MVKYYQPQQRYYVPFRPYTKRKAKKLPKIHVTNPVTGKQVLLSSLVRAVKKAPSTYAKLRKKKKTKTGVMVDKKNGDAVLVAEVARKKRPRTESSAPGAVGPHLEVPLPT